MLADFIEQSCGRDYGPMPCAFWVADAVRHETGFDPIADLRDRQMSWMDCRKILIAEGGLLNLAERRMVHPSLTVLDGDGVAVLKFEGRTYCGLIVDGRANLKTKTGVRIIDGYRIMRGWSCHRP